MAINNRNPAASTTHVRTDTPQHAQPQQSPSESQPPQLHSVSRSDHPPLLPTVPASTTATSAVTTTQPPTTASRAQLTPFPTPRRRPRW